MANPNEQTPAPAGVDAGPQSGAAGAGGEPKGTRPEAGPRDRSATETDDDMGDRRHARVPGTRQPGYRARPAGQSGLGAQPGRPSPLRQAQGEGNYAATDRGDEPLRNG